MCKKTLQKTTLAIAIFVALMSVSAYAQTCKPKPITLPKDPEPLVLKGNALNCSSYVFRIPRDTRFTVKLTAANPDVTFSMNRSPRVEQQGDDFCEDCKTLDEYFDGAASRWEIWVNAPEDSKPNAAAYTLSLRVTPAPPIVSKGILNSKATSLPNPVYPKIANNGESVFTPKGSTASRPVKKVTVKVVLTEDGTVYTADAIDGDESFRQPAMDAAMGAKFPPTLVNGKAVRVSGTIVVTFK